MVAKTINLALQGGGAHGAFTWGVLDRLLCHPEIGIEAISGTSAGAMNAVVLADGWARGGREGAREHLARFWHRVSDVARFSPIQRTPLDVFMGNWSLDTSPAYLMFDALTRVASPYQTNPFDFNPLRTILEETVDFDRACHLEEIKIFVSATNVHTGRIKVFNHRNLTLDMVMASACLPLVFQAVEIDGIPYWDGGYMGNPALFPLFPETTASDIVIVQINPVERKDTPKTSIEIMNRLNEITFNSSLLRELRAIHFVARLLDEAKLDANEYRKVHIHLIGDDENMKPLGASSKLNAERQFLDHLHEIGWSAADRFLATNFEKLGKQSSIDLRAMFQGVAAPPAFADS